MKRFSMLILALLAAACSLKEPAEFDRQDYLEAAERCLTPEGTADKWIRAFCG